MPQANDERRPPVSGDKVAHCLRQLTANLLRVARGSGRPQDLYQEMTRCLEAMHSYEQSNGRPIPASVIQSMLDWDQSWATSAPQPTQAAERGLGWERLLFLRNVTQASLQIAASSLLRQNTQLSQGQFEVFSAVKRFEESRKRASRGTHQRSRRISDSDDSDDHRRRRFDTATTPPRMASQLH